MNRNENTVRDHMTPDRHSSGYRIVLDIQNMQDKNQHLSRALPDLNERINANIQRVRDDHDLTLAEWFIWSDYANGRIAKMNTAAQR